MRSRVVRGTAFLLALVCLGTAVFFSYKIYDTKKQDREGAEAYAALLSEAVKNREPGESPASGTSGDHLTVEDPEYSLWEPIPEDELTGNTEAGDTENASGTDAGITSAGISGTNDPGIGLPAEPMPEDYPDVDMNYLKEVSPSIIGWLSCPGTVIDYPVAQGEDNQFYLTHLADGSRNRNGCLFIDCGNAPDFTDDNTIIYGHHMQSGAMFASLVNYGDPAYYRAHPYFYLTIEGIPYRIDVFSGYDAAVTDSAYSRNFRTKHDFAVWMREIVARSDFQANLELTTDDHIVTLSTCAYSFDNARYVLHGKLVRLERNRP